jgi:transposase
MPGAGAHAAGFASGDRAHPHQDPRLRAARHLDPGLRRGRLWFAALNYLEGKLITHLAKRHRHQEWLAFLKTIDDETPADLDIHIIADNYATHKHPVVSRWLDRHSRFHMHYTPTSSSWMNLVERFFRDLTEFITEKSFASTRDPADAIIACLAARNENPRRYVWKAKGEDMLRKINAARQALAPGRQGKLYFGDSALAFRAALPRAIATR